MASTPDDHGFRDFTQHSLSCCSVAWKLTSCSSLLSVVKRSDRKQNGEERICLALTSRSQSVIKQGRNSIGSLKQKPWGTMLAGLHSDSCSTSFS